jgi:hypothetical protein
LLVSLYARGP